MGKCGESGRIKQSGWTLTKKNRVGEWDNEKEISGADNNKKNWRRREREMWFLVFGFL